MSNRFEAPRNGPKPKFEPSNDAWLGTPDGKRATRGGRAEHGAGIPKKSPGEPPDPDEKVKITFHKPKETPPKTAKPSKDESVDINVEEFAVPDESVDLDVENGLTLAPEKDHDLDLDLSGIEEKPKSSHEDLKAKVIAARRKENADDLAADELRKAQGFRAVGEHVFEKNKELIKYFNDNAEMQARFKSGLRSLVNISAILYDCDPKDLLKNSEFNEDLSVFIKPYKEQAKLHESGKRPE